MVDIQSATVEIRRGKKTRRRKNKRQDENIYGPPYYIDNTISPWLIDLRTALLERHAITHSWQWEQRISLALLRLLVAYAYSLCGLWCLSKIDESCRRGCPAPCSNAFVYTRKFWCSDDTASFDEMRHGVFAVSLIDWVWFNVPLKIL